MKALQRAVAGRVGWFVCLVLLFVLNERVCSVVPVLHCLQVCVQLIQLKADVNSQDTTYDRTPLSYVTTPEVCVRTHVPPWGGGVRECEEASSPRTTHYLSMYGCVLQKR